MLYTCLLASESSPWTNISRFLTEEARKTFAAQLDAATPTQRDEFQLGLAASLLTAPPTSEGRLDEVEERLRHLIAGPRGPEALWLLARIPHVHRSKPDLAEAMIRYRALMAAHPGHVLAAQAEVKLAILDLGPLSLSGQDDTRRSGLLATHEAALRNMADPVARRDLRLVLGEAWLLAGGRGEALAHFEAVLADHLVSGPTAGDLLVRAGELARLLGEPGRAAGHYQAFLAAWPRDQRAYLVSQRLHEVSP